MTLTSDPLTLNIHGRWRVMCSIYAPNLSEIDQRAAELLMINDRFLDRPFLGDASIPARVFLKTCGPICTKLGVGIVRSSLHTQFKNGEDILLGFQTTGAKS